MGKLLLLIFLLFHFVEVEAQGHGYMFNHIGIRDGLHQEIVTSVQQDAKGFIWISAGDVLQRYDGFRFQNFHTGSKKSGLPDGSIRGLSIDSKNRIWLLIGDSAVGFMDAENFSYHPVKVIVPEGFPRVATALQIDKDDRPILIYGNKGIITYSGKNKTISIKNNPFVIPKGWEPWFFWQDNDKNFWVGSPNGLLKYDPSKNQYAYRGHNENSDPYIAAFKDARTVVFFLKDGKNRGWITAHPPEGTYIKSFDPLSGTVKEWQKQVSSVLQGAYFNMYGISESSGSLWMAGYNLFAKINYDQGTLERIPSSLPGEFSIRYDDIYQLYEDREKNVWVSTNKGLFRFNPTMQAFGKVNNRGLGSDSIYTPDVTDILETDKEILVSTWGNNVFAYDKNFNPVRSEFIKQDNKRGFEMVWSMVQRKNGDIWYGLQGGTIYINEAKTLKRKIIRSPEIGESTIRQVTDDHSGNVWLGCQNGKLVKWNADSMTFRLMHKFKGLVTLLMTDHRNNLWVVTDRDGVYRLNTSDGSVIQHFDANASQGKRLRINGASSMLQYNDSIYLIASDGINMYNDRQKQFRYITVEQGLPSDDIMMMVKDHDGYVWMSTTMGIVSYHPLLNSIVTYDYNDGIHTYAFNHSSGALLKDGRVVFGTNHDLVVFDPRKLMSSKKQVPPVSVAGIEIADRLYPVDSLMKQGKLKLRYDQNSFTAFFSTLTYHTIHPVYFMMDGKDKDWKKAGLKNIVEFSYLPPGEYTLKLACKNENGEPGPITSLIIDIAPPFYQAWWFYITLALAAGAFLFWLDKERMKRKESIVEMRTNIAGKLHNEVNTALSSIHVLSEMAMFKADKDATKAVEFIEQIRLKSGNMIQAMDDMLWSLSPENDSMDKTVARMHECIDNTNSRDNTRFELATDEKVKILRLDMQQRMQVFLLFKQLMTEIKEANVHECRFRIKAEKSRLIFDLEIEDADVNSDQLRSRLHGYDLVKKMQQMKADLQVKQDVGVTSIKCRINLQE